MSRRRLLSTLPISWLSHVPTTIRTLMGLHYQTRSIMRRTSSAPDTKARRGAATGQKFSCLRKKAWLASPRRPGVLLTDRVGRYLMHGPRRRGCRMPLPQKEVREASDDAVWRAPWSGERPVRARRLPVVVPTFNEAENIASLVGSLLGLKMPG